MSTGKTKRKIEKRNRLIFLSCLSNWNLYGSHISPFSRSEERGRGRGRYSNDRGQRGGSMNRGGRGGRGGVGGSGGGGFSGGPGGMPMDMIPPQMMAQFMAPPPHHHHGGIPPFPGLDGFLPGKRNTTKISNLVSGVFFYIFFYRTPSRLPSRWCRFLSTSSSWHDPSWCRWSRWFLPRRWARWWIPAWRIPAWRIPSKGWIRNAP